MLTQFELWSFKTPKYHFKWYLEPNEKAQDFTSILTVQDKEEVEIYRDYRYGCGFGTHDSIDGTPNQSLPFYAMVKEAIKFLKQRSKNNVNIIKSKS